MRKKQKKKIAPLFSKRHFVVHQGEKIKQEFRKTADDSVNSTNSDQYAEDSLENGFRNMADLTRNTAWNTAAKAHRKVSEHQEKKGSEQAAPQSKQRNPTPRDKGWNVRQGELRKQFFRNEIIRKRIEEFQVSRAYQGLQRYASQVGSFTRRTGSRLADKILFQLRQTGQKLLRVAGRALATAAPAGIVIVMLILFIGAVASIFGSPMGILFAGENNDPNSIPIPSIVRDTNEQFGLELNRIIRQHPECTEIDIRYYYDSGYSWSSYWPEILSVFAVHHNIHMDQDVIVIDESKKQQIQDIFWLMHKIDSEITSRVIEIEHPLPTPAPGVRPGMRPDGQPETPQIEYRTIYTMHIAVSSKTVDQLADELHFTAEEKAILAEMLSNEMRPYLVALSVSGSINGVGALQWPLPGYTRISTYFGVPDAFGRPGHKGIDIPAPAGTPIQAAHSGTVQIANLSTSYGYQVMLDSGDGTCTRYAHMTNYVVAPGQTVTAGEIIGFVGNTGMSTGNHLHFEVIINGQLVDPLGCLD